MDLPRTRAALARYDATAEERAIIHNDDPDAFAAAERAALDVVRAAFAEETADRNRWETAMQAQLNWLREWTAAKWKCAKCAKFRVHGEGCLCRSCAGQAALDAAESEGW